jgi:hypothetical protein
MVWDQQRQYFESQGEIRTLRAMFKAKLYNILWIWKAAGDEVLLSGDFNKDVYYWELARYISGGEFRMKEMCFQTTGTRLPSTHLHGRTPIDALFSTSG